MKNLMGVIIDSIISSFKISFRETLFVVWQGYGEIKILMYIFLFKKPNYIYNTYKVPKISNYMNILHIIKYHISCLLISRAKIVVCISNIQCAELRRLNKNSMFIPFASDIKWWTPGVASENILKKYNIYNKKYILIMGDVDRDDETVSQAVGSLGIPIVRVTRSTKTAQKVKDIYSRHGIKNTIVLTLISYFDLRELYRGANFVLISSDSSIHPAGMTSLTEAMSCGCKVIIRKGLTTEGYVVSDKNALVVQTWNSNFLTQKIEKIIKTKGLDVLSINARDEVEKKLNFDISSYLLINYFNKVICRN